MPTFSSPNRAEALLTASLEEESGQPELDTPFRILLLGDFSGRESRGVCETDSLGFDRLPMRVDREDLDDVLEKLGVEIRLYLADGLASFVRPRDLEGFHPDRILERAGAFNLLRETREGLSDPETYASAAETVRSWGSMHPAADAGSVPEAEPEPPPLPEAAGARPRDLAAELLEAHRKRIPKPSESPDFDAMIRDIVRPHLAPSDDAEKADLIARIDEAIGSWMRNLLHDPAFQSIEAAWRGLDFLLRRIETGTDLQVFLLDVSKGELARHLKSARELSGSGLHRILVRDAKETPGAAPWSVLAGLYAFGPNVEDVALLARLGKLAAAAGAPFLSGAAPQIFACDSLESPPEPRRWEADRESPEEQLWAALRELPEARFLGLAAPRFLLRLPYGKATDPTERFDFEEIEDAPSHEDYLWGNPALVCLSLLGAARAEGGGPIPARTATASLTGLPLHVYERDGERRIKPCAETLLPSRVAEAMLDRGVMAVLSLQGRDAVALARFQTIEIHPRPLPGLGGS